MQDQQVDEWSQWMSSEKQVKDQSWNQQNYNPDLTLDRTAISNNDDDVQQLADPQSETNPPEWSNVQQNFDLVQEITLISDDIKIDIDVVNGSSDLVEWMRNVSVEQTDDFLNYVNEVENQLQEKCKSDKDFYYIVERLLQFQFQGFRYQSYPESSFSSSVYHACLDHQFFNENGLNNDYIKTFKRYLAINGTNDINQIENYLKLYALSQTITEQTLTINRTTETTGTTATQAIYRNEYIIYTDPNLKAGYCSVVCDKCGAKIVNDVGAFVEYLEKVYNNEPITGESLSNFHHINCGNQFFTKIGVGIKGSKSGIKSYEYIGRGDSTELDRIQWELLPDFSILGEAFKEGDIFKSSNYSGRSRRRGGVKTNLTIDANGQAQDEANKINQLAATTLNAGVPQAPDQNIANAFNDIPDDTITQFNEQQDGTVVLGVDVIQDLVQIRQTLIELFGNNVMYQREKDLRIKSQFNEMDECFKRAFREEDGRKSYKNFQEIVTYLFRFKQFVDTVYEQYIQNPHEMYTGNVDDIINTVNRLISWITAVWKKIQVFVQILFWSGQQDAQADETLQHIRQQILDAQQQNAQQQNDQQQQQNLGKNILHWCYDIMVYKFTYGNNQNAQDFRNHVNGLLNGFVLFDIYDRIQNNQLQNLPQDHFDLLINYYNTSIHLDDNSIVRDLRDFIIMLYAYLLCRNDKENANMFNQMICELKHVKVQIKQVHVFRVAHLIDLGKQIHCLWQNNRIEWGNPLRAWGGNPPRNINGVINGNGWFGDDGLYNRVGVANAESYDDMSKKYADFGYNVTQFQKALQVKIAPQLEPVNVAAPRMRPNFQLNWPQVPRECLFQIQHQIPLNTQDIGNDQDIEATNNIFGQLYDGMNARNHQRIVFSPIFGHIFDPIRVDNINGLDQSDRNYFRKQAVKYMITHNMLKYHYPEITLQTQNRFVNKYMTNRVGQNMNILIHDVITNLKNALYDGVYEHYITERINGRDIVRTKRNIVLTVGINGNNCNVVVEQHDERNPTTLAYKINVIGRSREIFNRHIGDWYTPWEQIYLIFNANDDVILRRNVFGNRQLIEYISFLHEQYINIITRRYNRNQFQQTCQNKYNGQFNNHGSNYTTNEFYRYCKYNDTQGKTPAEIFERQLQHLYRFVQKINIGIQAVYVNHGLFYICPVDKNILDTYNYFLDLIPPAAGGVGFNPNNPIQQKFFKLQIYGKFLYDLIIHRIRDDNLYSFTQTSSAYSTLVNMWLHADDNLQHTNPNLPPPDNMVNDMPQAVTNIIESIPNNGVRNTANDVNPFVLKSLNQIYNKAFPPNQQPQNFMKTIIKQIIAIIVLKSFVNGNAYVFQNEGIRNRIDNGGTFRGAYMDIINTKFEKIKELINVFIPDPNNQVDYDAIIQNIQDYITQQRDNNVVAIEFNQNNFNNFINALRNLVGQCDQQYPLDQDINLLPHPPHPPHPAP